MTESNTLSKLNEIEAVAVERVIERRKSIKDAASLQSAIKYGDIAVLSEVLFENPEEVWELLDDDMEKLRDFFNVIWGNDKLKK